MLAALWPADPLGRGVSLLLLLLSLLSWWVLLYKAWVLARAQQAVARALAAFWQAPDWAQARQNNCVWDAEQWLQPLLDALQASPTTGLGAQLAHAQRCTAVLREALRSVSGRLHWGHTLLASVAAVAPFVGLLGTVGGIYHVLQDLALGGAPSLERIAAPVGETLAMTAAGLVVAIPAALGYNFLGRWSAALQERLDGFAWDLQACAVQGLVGPAAPVRS